jgi:LDH2 family malate/lactate/ureidoglycolate dehydrogenase
MPVFHVAQLMGISMRLLEAAGVPPDTARQVAVSLIEGNLAGHDSHGVIRLTQYVHGMERGQIDPHAQLEVLRETSTTALIDAHWAFGQIAARRAMEIAIEKARQHSLGAVGLRNSGHIGRLGEYALMAVEHGMIGWVTCNSSQLTAPYGGVDRVFGTNPFAYAFPRSGQPFLMDFATSVAAEGKLRVAMSKGAPIPEGWILDKDRNPTTNPADFYDGGVILPLGGHKGYGFLMVADLLGGALTGHGCTSLPEHSAGNGVFLMAMDIAAFCPVEELTDTVDRLSAYIKASRKAPGFDEILIPGEPEFRAKAQRERDGIYLPDATWREMVEVAGQYGLTETVLVGAG